MGTFFTVHSDTIRYSLFQWTLYAIHCLYVIQWTLYDIHCLYAIHCSSGHYTLFIVNTLSSGHYTIFIVYTLSILSLSIFIVPVDTIRYSLFIRTQYAIHCSLGHYMLFNVPMDTIRYLMFPWTLYAIQCFRGHYTLFIVPVDTIRYSLFPWTLYVIHKPLGECPRNQDFQSPIFPRPLTVFTGHSLHSFILTVLPSVTPSAFVVLCLVRPDPSLRRLTC